MDIDPSIEYYVSIGAVEVVGVEEDGEILFRLTESAKELAPRLWQIHQKHVDEVLVDLFKRDLLSVTYNENLEAIIELTDEGKELARAAGLIDFKD